VALQTWQTYQPAYRADMQFVYGNPIMDLIPPDFVIQYYLRGLPLTSTVTGESLEGIVEQKIHAAVGEFETRMNTFIVKRKILSCVINQEPVIITDLSTTQNPWGMVSGTPAVAGVDYDILEPPYDYTSRRFEKWMLVKTKHRPVISIDWMMFALPPNFGILVVPNPWITCEPLAGGIRIVPVEGAMAVTSPGAGMWLPFFTMGSMDHVPQFTQIRYTAGIDPIPDDMRHAIAMLAAAYVLDIYNTAYYPGMQSFSHSVDGFTQSVSLRANGPFTRQIERFEKKAYEYMDTWREGRSGIRFASLGR